jgi:hypothetical protein
MEVYNSVSRQLNNKLPVMENKMQMFMDVEVLKRIIPMPAVLVNKYATIIISLAIIFDA